MELPSPACPRIYTTRHMELLASFLYIHFLEVSFIMNFTAGVVGRFYQFNTMGDAQVRECASNRSHTHPTASLQNPTRAASKGQMMGHKRNANAARCSVGPITRPSMQDHLHLLENVTPILMHILHHHHALEEGWLGTHLGSVYFSLFSGKAPVVSAVMQAARHGFSVRL